MPFGSHEEHRGSRQSGIQRPCQPRLGPRPPIAPTAEALGKKESAIVHSAIYLIVGARQVSYLVPGIGIREVADAFKQAVNHVVTVEQRKSIPGTAEVPGRTKTENSVRVDPACRAILVPGVVFGDQILVGKLSA